MNATRRCARIAAAALMLVGWVLPGAAAETVVTVGGTGSALGSMKIIAGVYEKKHPGVTVKILPSLGSTAGIKAVIGGAIALGLSSRPLSENERKQGAVEVEFARSPFVFISHPGSTQKNITLQELERIYADPSARWNDGRRIRLILRPEKDIDTSLLRGLSPGMELSVKSAQARPGMIKAVTDQESTDMVAKTPGALGCATLSEVISEKRQVHILAFNGVKPNAGNRANGSYPMSKSLYLVTTSHTPPAALQFAEFVRSPEAGRLLSSLGSLPVPAKGAK